MSVRRVNAGEPITAFWANSIVNALDTIGGNRTASNSGFTTLAPQQFNNPTAFQIQMTSSGCWTIEAGTIYINGELIKGKGSTYGNHATSLQNWDSCYFYKGKKLPKWKIKGYIPKNATGEISGSKFWLINENNEESQEGNTDNPPEEVPEGYTWWETYINDIDEKQGTIKQLVTGTIHITLPVAVATMRPFDITITGVKVNEQPVPEGEESQPETEGEESEAETVQLEVCSGSILMPNKERIFIPQRLQLEHSTAEPFFVVLTVKRTAEGIAKFKYEIKTESTMSNEGWTFTEAEEEL